MLGEILDGQGEEGIRRRLAAALDPGLRGMVGHCDGLDRQASILTGWAHRGRRGACGIWLQRPGQAATPVACDQVRADIVRQGQAMACGFSIPWQERDTPAAVGVRLTFDRQGLLPLPGLL